ncbi:hypothetical protein [Rhodoblastus sp.]|uniref:hypothetical protein n=1 Tax=Rhodoblastus sp. TaxID=1962975 RepID=UPI002627DDF9|nr:hypothetical protein [Rhodoblastus sp.]
MGQHYLTEMVIHVTETLDESSVRAAECDLCGFDGVVEAKHNPGRNHILVVTYDTEETRMINLLTPLKARGLHAQLVGIMHTRAVGR